MLQDKSHRHKGRLAAPLFALVIALSLTSCGSDGIRAAGRDVASAGEAGIGESDPFPLVIDGDRLGVSSLDGNPPTVISGPGYIDGAAYDAAGALIFVQHSGKEPGFYRVENGSQQLVIPLPRIDPSVPAKWSRDGAEAAWIEPDGDGYKLALARPGEKPRYVQHEGIKDFLWSPDGRQILAWDGWDAAAIYLIDTETAEVDATALEGLPAAWAPSGDILIWEKTSETNPYPRRVVLMHPDGSERRVLGNVTLGDEGPLPVPAFSPDGKWLAWGGSIAATDGSVSTALRCDEQCTPHSSGSSPTWSPDGKQIAWGQDNHILVADVGVWEGRVVADGWVPSWSPEGSTIAYVDRKDNSSALFALSLDDGRETKVVDLVLYSGPYVQIAWSPDGRQLAVPLQASDKSKLFSLNIRSGDLQRLPVALSLSASASLVGDGAAVMVYGSGGWTLEGLDGTSRPVPCINFYGRPADWSPDGRHVLCAGSTGLQMVDIATGQAQSLPATSVESAKWSPDESAVAFAHLHQGHTLSVLNTDSGEAKDIATELRSDRAGYYFESDSYAWSPDGKGIAFTNWRPVNSSANPGASTISVVGADGEDLRQVTDSPGFKRDLVFSPDGLYLAYTDSEAGVTAVNVATGNRTVIASDSRTAPIWSDPTSLLVRDQLGMSIIGLDGSARLLVAWASGCEQEPIGWSGGKLFFTNTCSHQGE